MAWFWLVFCFSPRPEFLLLRVVICRKMGAGKSFVRGKMQNVFLKALKISKPVKKEGSTVLLSENPQAVLMETVFPALAKHAMDAYS